MKTNDLHVEKIIESIDYVAASLRSISHGGQTGPEGLEMLSIAVGGEGLGNSLGDSVSGCGTAVAEAIREGMEYVGDANERGLKAIADAIREGAGG